MLEIRQTQRGEMLAQKCKYAHLSVGGLSVGEITVRTQLYTICA
jgi:hypothetical protein